MDHRFATRQNALRKFARDCERSLPEEQAARIREAMALPGFAPAGVPPRSKNQIESMLAAGAFESAALALLTPGSGLMISRGGGNSLASVVLPGKEREVTAEGKTIALAILQAHALALLAEADEPET